MFSLRVIAILVLTSSLTGCLQVMDALAIPPSHGQEPTRILAEHDVHGAAPDTQPHPVMLRYPDVGPTHIVFVYADDLWVVSRSGGLASPLASPPGLETFPKFSADGRTIAFVGNYDGNTDLYTLPTEGGVPSRVTHHPASETLCDWTPRGKLLFYSNAFTGLRRQSLSRKCGTGL